MNKATDNTKTITLKVGGATNPGSLKTTICSLLKNRNTIVNLVCIGVAPNYIATKSLILARCYLQGFNRKLKYDCYYTEVVIDGDESSEIDRHKTAIRWEVSLD